MDQEDIDEGATVQVDTDEGSGLRPPIPPPTLRRNTAKQMLGGVASGLGRRFDIETNIVRAIFIVLAFVWGLGIAIYLILWAIIPKDDNAPAADTESNRGSDADRQPSRWLSVVILGGALCVGLIVWSVYLNAPRFGSGVGVIWLIVLGTLAVISLQGPAGHISLRRCLGIFFLALLSILIIGCGGFLGYLALTGVPLSGGIGEKLYQPTSIAQVNKDYQTTFGTMTVDLRQVPFGDHTISVTASVATGQLTVEVPAGVVVDVSATSGTPHISYPQGFGAFYVPAVRGKRQPHLILNAKVGIGQIELIRDKAQVGIFPY